MSHLSKHQRFEMRVVDRREIQLADYNPRTISAHAKKQLKSALKDVGLLQPLIWNQRSKVLVSGHQRLFVLDELERYTPGGAKSYTLEVAAVDLDEKAERRMNVFLNNPSAMGEFDFEALNHLRLEFDFSADDLGFSAEDMEVLFPVEIPDALKDTAEASRTKNTLSKIKEDRKKAKDELQDKQSIGYYFTVVCKTLNDKERLLEALGIPGYEEFVRGELVAAKAGVTLAADVISAEPPQT